MEDMIARIKAFFGIHDRRLTVQEQAAVEICLYTVSGGAFALFVRWMQKMIGYNEAGLPNPGFWNGAVVVMAAFAAFLLTRLVDKLKNRRWFLPRSHREVFSNGNKWLKLAANTAAFIMFVGAVATVAGSSLEKNRNMLYITSAFAILAAVGFSIMLSAANTGRMKLITLRTAACGPMLFYSLWLVTAYSGNSVNPVVWDYGPEILTLTVLIFTAFRLGGIYFFMFRPSRTIFLCCFGAFLCLMNLADSRFIGMQMMFLASAAYLIVFAMIMIINMQEKDSPSSIAINDGFERE